MKGRCLWFPISSNFLNILHFIHLSVEIFNFDIIAFVESIVFNALAESTLRSTSATSYLFFTYIEIDIHLSEFCSFCISCVRGLAPSI